MSTEAVGIDVGGRVALVCGGSGGIGTAIVRVLRAAGARVFSGDLPGRDAPAGAEGLAFDLTDPEAVREHVDGLVDSAGRLDILVHGAGITRDGVLWKMEDDAWHDVLRTNLDSAFYLVRSSVPHMRERGGTITFISSINGQRGKFGQGNYAASKAGLDGLMRTAAREVGRFGIRVNAVAPGLIRTPMTAELPAALTDTATEESVLGRLGEPEDVAHAVLFLASDLARHVTGQVLRVDGGQLIA